MDKEMQVRLERGREHYQNKEYSKAEPYLLKVAEAHSGFADVMNMLGVIFHDRGQVALAQEYFEKALRINPRYTEAALNLSVTYNEQGMYEQAREIHEHATSLQPQRSREIEPYARGKLTNMHADLGQAYSELQMYDKAIEQFHEALSLSPDFSDIRTKLGHILRDAGHQEEAVAELMKVKDKNPKYVPARVSLGAAYFAGGDKHSARDEWVEVLEIDPDNRTAGMYLRMVDQILALEEAENAGVHLEVEEPEVGSSSDGSEKDELDFSFDGERSSVMPAPAAGSKDDE